MRFLLLTPLIESALLKMWLKVERSSLQFINLNLLRSKRNENWTFWGSPFQSLFDWFMLSSGGRTKDLVRKICFGIFLLQLWHRVQRGDVFVFRTSKRDQTPSKTSEKMGYFDRVTVIDFQKVSTWCKLIRSLEIVYSRFIKIPLS